MNDHTESLLRAILITLGRAAFTPEEIYGLITPKGTSKKNLIAYNLADGTKTQSDIAKEAKIDVGNFSRIVNRWIQDGIMFRLDNSRLLHIYPIPPESYN